MSRFALSMVEILLHLFYLAGCLIGGLTLLWVVLLLFWIGSDQNYPGTILLATPYYWWVAFGNIFLVLRWTKTIRYSRILHPEIHRTFGEL